MSTASGPGGPAEPPEGEDGPPRLTRLDPLRRPESNRAESPASPREVIDTRRYRWMIGIIGLVLLVAASVFGIVNRGTSTIGIPAGQRLHVFAAPLGNSTLVGDPTLNPVCTAARHDRRALNVCLLAKRGPLVLTFFVPRSQECVRQVDALQAVSARVPRREVTFAALAVGAHRAATAALIRAHHWTIPVAYDRDGAIGSVYGVAICPLTELAYRGGVVQRRLIGDRWSSAAALLPAVKTLIRSGASR